MLFASVFHREMTKDVNGGFRSPFLQTRFNSSFDMHGYRLLVVFWEVQVHILLRCYVLCFVVKT